MDIDRVRYFHVVAECGSFVKASEILGISQPALSKAMKRLEDETGLSLFISEGRGLKLTESGNALRVKTDPLLKQWLGIPKELKSSTSTSAIKIGSFEVFTTYFLRSLIQNADLKFLELYEYGPGSLEQAIIDRKVDIGVTYIPVPKSGIEFTEVTKIEMGVFGIKKYKNREYRDLPFVVPLSPPQGTPSKVMGLDGWPDHRFERLIQFRVTLMQSAIELCQNGLCVAYLPRFIADFHSQVVLPEYRFLELDCPLPKKDRIQSVYAITRKAESESPLLRQIAKSLRSLST